MNMIEKKRELRQLIKERALHIESTFLTHSAKLIVDYLLESPLYHNCTTLLGFIPLADEVDITPLFDDALNRGKQLAFPKILEPPFMEFRTVDTPWNRHLIANRWGVMEPSIKDSHLLQITEEHVFLILVPAIAYSPLKERLGRGKGYYDNYLKSVASHFTSVGICYDYQLLPTLPTTNKDQKVDFLITPSQIY